MNLAKKTTTSRSTEEGILLGEESMLVLYRVVQVNPDFWAKELVIPVPVVLGLDRLLGHVLLGAPEGLDSGLIAKANLTNIDHFTCSIH